MSVPPPGPSGAPVNPFPNGQPNSGFGGGPPPGFPPDVFSPARAAESRAATVYGICITFTILSSVSVILRLYTRHKILRNIGPDDIVIVIGQIFSIATTITTCHQVTVGGLGRHFEFLGLDTMQTGLKLFYATTLLYNVAQMATKISFLIQFRRLFPGRNIRAVCTYGMIFLGVWLVAQEFYTAFACVPLEMLLPQWKGRCVPTFIVLNLNSIFNVITDFAIFTIPIWPVIKLQMPRRRKLNLLGVFCLGFTCCVISIIRLSQLYKAGGDSPDMTYLLAPTMYLSTLELNMGILCACLPTLRPFLKKFAPAILGTSRQGKSTGQYSHTLSTLKSKKSNTGADGIYIHREVEFQSTAELQSKEHGKDPFSIRSESFDEVISNDAQVTSKARGGHV